MPLSTIDTAFVKQYESNLYLLSEQMGSKFQPNVTVKPVTNAEEAYWDTLGSVAAQEITGRHSDTPLNEATHGRRKAIMRDFDTCSPLDREDELKMLIQPTSGYAIKQANALGKTKDDLVIEAALGTALVGKTGATSVTFANDSVSINGDGTVTTLGTLAAVATITNMNLRKILTMMQVFNEADVDPDLAKYWGVTPKDVKDMLDVTEITSADYVTLKVLQAGKMETFAGFKFFWSNRLTTDAVTGTGYRTFAWAQDGIYLGLAKEVSSRIDERTDKRYMLQVYSKMSMGAVRMEGARVHECLTKVANTVDS